MNTSQPPHINHILHNARGSTESLRLRYFSLKRETETVYYARHSVGIHFGRPAGPPGAAPPFIKGVLCGHENMTVYQDGCAMMYRKCIGSIAAGFYVFFGKGCWGVYFVELYCFGNLVVFIF